MENAGRGEEEEEQQGYDRAKEVKRFDDSKMGVKGLVDSGITSIPRFFIHPPDSLPCAATPIAFPPPASDPIPTIDLSGFHSNRRSIIVNQIRDASRTLGFFQVINRDLAPLPRGRGCSAHPRDVHCHAHSPIHWAVCMAAHIPWMCAGALERIFFLPEVIDRTIAKIKAFHEQPTEIKALHYSLDLGRSVSYYSNANLYKSKAANWGDSLRIRWDPDIDTGKIPEICRRELVEWDREVQRLGETLMEILSEGLGVEAGRLKALGSTESRILAAQYYPFCPQPDLTLGHGSHKDRRVLTVLLQNQIGGLQVKHGEHWLDVKPVPGALAINIGDLLQMISNGEYRSVEHRVLANRLREPRISVAIFFDPSKREELYGPLPELISTEKPALYRSFTFSEFLLKYAELGHKSYISHFQL